MFFLYKHLYLYYNIRHLGDNMDNYEKLLEEINLFLTKEEVNNENTNTEIISLYDLFIIMDKEFEKLRKLSNIDKTYCQKLRTFRKYLFGRYDDFFIRNDCCVDIYADENISKIILKNSDSDMADDFYRISIIKDNNKDELYLDKTMDWHNKQICKFIKKNFDSLLDTLSNIEEYYNLLGKTSNKDKELFSFDGSTNLFTYQIIYDKNGNSRLNYYISPKHPLYGECKKNYLNKKNIIEYVDENKVNILKRIPISVNELPVRVLNIYNKGKEYQKEKELEKSIKWWN